MQFDSPYSTRVWLFFCHYKQPAGENFISPQAYVTSTMRTRGYHANTYSAIKTAYHNKPTSIQTASYGKFLVKAVRENDTDTLRELFSLGLSPNACNTHGESIVHTASRLGKLASLQVMLDFGATVSVCDDYGRTPLHDACWQNEHPQFGLVEVLLQHDPHLLFIQDARGSSPMSYIPRDRWNEWTRFFMSKKDLFWPKRDWETHGFQPDPARTQEAPNARPIQQEVDVGLTLDILQMIAEGSLDCSGVLSASRGNKHKSDRTSGSATTLTWEDDDDDDDDDDSFSSDYSYDSDDDSEDEDDSSTCTFDEDEMNAILDSIGNSKPVRWSASSFDLPEGFLEDL